VNYCVQSINFIRIHLAYSYTSFVWNFYLPASDFVDDIMWVYPIYGTTDGLSGAQYLLHCSLELLGNGSMTHLTGDIYNLLKAQITAVSHILHLFSVSLWLLQLTDDEHGGRWNNIDFGHSILDGELAGDLQAFVLCRCSAYVFTNLFWIQAKGSNFWR